MTALEVFTQSDGSVTCWYYKQLEERGPIGLIALNLFRACKTSTRAKIYKSRRYRGDAYHVKNWSLVNLCIILQDHGASRGIPWGWKEDPKTIGFEWVLYIDLPQGQVSFHSPVRGQGPDYAGDWDQQKKSQERILAFCDNVLGAKPVPVDANADRPLRLKKARKTNFAMPPPALVVPGIHEKGGSPTLSRCAASDQEPPKQTTEAEALDLWGDALFSGWTKATEIVEPKQASLFPDVRKGD